MLWKLMSYLPNKFGENVKMAWMHYQNRVIFNTSLYPLISRYEILNWISLDFNPYRIQRDNICFGNWCRTYEINSMKKYQNVKKCQNGIILNWIFAPGRHYTLISKLLLHKSWNVHCILGNQIYEILNWISLEFIICTSH